MSKRTERVSMEIQRVLSDVLLRGLPDSHDSVSITSVVCSPDLRCQSSLCSYGWVRDVDTIMAGLEEIGGFINREVAKKIKMKHSPKLDLSDELL